MSNQYEVLGKAPTPEDLKKLSPDEIHLTIKNLNAGYGKMEILHNFDLFVNKAQSLCLIGPNGAGKSTIKISWNCIYLARQFSIPRYDS
jgi:branched-chain amino acid transport system ATP-binding protein